MFRNALSRIRRPILATTSTRRAKSANTSQNIYKPRWKDPKYLDDPEYKNIKNWLVEELDPRGGEPTFVNLALDPDDSSYDPPYGFTAEEILQFKDAKKCFKSLEEVRKTLEWRDIHGSRERSLEY